MKPLELLVFSIVLNMLWTCAWSLPVWMLWSAAGLGQHYFSFLPEAWRSIPLHHVVALFTLVLMIRSAVTRMTFEAKA